MLQIKSISVEDAVNELINLLCGEGPSGEYDAELEAAAAAESPSGAEAEEVDEGSTGAPADGAKATENGQSGFLSLVIRYSLFTFFLPFFLLFFLFIHYSAFAYLDSS